MKFISEEEIYRCKELASDYDGSMSIDLFAEHLEKIIAKKIIDSCAVKAKDVLHRRRIGIGEQDAVYQSVKSLVAKHKL